LEWNITLTNVIHLLPGSNPHPTYRAIVHIFGKSHSKNHLITDMICIVIISQSKYFLTTENDTTETSRVRPKEGNDLLESSHTKFIKATLAGFQV
jgi:hypothetical protein